MAHLQVKSNQSKKGLTWLVVNREWNTKLKKYRTKKLTPVAFQDLGFSDKMTLKQARDHAKKINKLNAVKRKETQKKVQASENLQTLVIKSNELFPELLVEQFVDHIEDNWWGGSYNLKKTILNFSKAQKIIIELNVLPNEYFKKKNRFYKYFQKNQISMSYIEKLTKVINQWGEFYSEETLTYFKKLPYPQGQILEQINSHAKVSGEGAFPMNRRLLMRLQNLPSGQYEYVHATFYLGLRPSELDSMLKDKKNYKITTTQGVKVLKVNQSKLSSVSESKRWKQIPAILPEQTQALENLVSGKMKKPLLKTIKRILSDTPSIGLYSGRKGFTDLMLAHGQTLEDISAWMCHKSIDRTWKHYKNKQNVHFTPLKKATND